MVADDYRRVLTATQRDRRDLFLAAAQRLGTPLGNVEKDFWVCWTLGVLYHDLPRGGPRFLFKGGTSLSKAYGLISRFSEDIDVTVFRDDLDHPVSAETLQALSNRRRREELDAIRDSCRAYVAGPLQDGLGARLASVTHGEGRIEVDSADADGQTLLLWYPTVEATTDPYVRPVVRLESGAKSALDPHRRVSIRPYVSDDVQNLNLTVSGVTTIEPARTFWDKIVIAHGLRRWYERRGTLRQEGQRVSRHYYDLYCLVRSDVGIAALADRELGADCVRHARLFFNRPDYDLASARSGSFAIAPVDGMIDALRRDFDQMAGMIFGVVPAFTDIHNSMLELHELVNA
jgi:Nucleotidyl transferase AbiEii toxin, Type IV TA system